MRSPASNTRLRAVPGTTRASSSAVLPSAESLTDPGHQALRQQLLRCETGHRVIDGRHIVRLNAAHQTEAPEAIRELLRIVVVVEDTSGMHQQELDVPIDETFQSIRKVPLRGEAHPQVEVRIAPLRHLPRPANAETAPE